MSLRSPARAVSSEAPAEMGSQKIAARDGSDFAGRDRTIGGEEGSLRRHLKLQGDLVVPRRRQDYHTVPQITNAEEAIAELGNVAKHPIRGCRIYIGAVTTAY